MSTKAVLIATAAGALPAIGAAMITGLLRYRVMNAEENQWGGAHGGRSPHHLRTFCITHTSIRVAVSAETGKRFIAKRKFGISPGKSGSATSNTGN
jgi:hypothetical protein